MLTDKRFGWFSIAAIAVFVYLVLVNAMIFPMVFPDGLAEKFTNTREQNQPIYHLLAFAATAILLTVLVDLLVDGPHGYMKALLMGMLLGLLVALPEHLHLYAMIDVGFREQFIPVIWTLLTWGIGGLIVGLVRHAAAQRGGSSI